jgi:hypothetical protein
MFINIRPFSVSVSFSVSNGVDSDPDPDTDTDSTGHIHAFTLCLMEFILTFEPLTNNSFSLRNG